MIQSDRFFSVPVIALYKLLAERKKCTALKTPILATLQNPHCFSKIVFSYVAVL